MAVSLSRDVPLALEHSVMLVIDVQNFSCLKTGGEFKDVPSSEMKPLDFFFDELERKIIPNIRQLQSACRESGIEVMYTVIESLTRDGRDRGLDYKITGLHVPNGSFDAQVIEAIKPAADEIVIPKTSSSVFNSTHIDYVLRNLECTHLAICGILTDQCVESAVRDACDLNYLVTLVTDACTTYTPERHLNSLRTIKGYCRQLTTRELVEEVKRLRRGRVDNDRSPRPAAIRGRE